MTWTIHQREEGEGECGPGLWITDSEDAEGRFKRTVVDTGALEAWPLSEADKRIIEAAPDMLDKLEELLELTEPFLPDLDQPYRDKWQQISSATADIRNGTGV